MLDFADEVSGYLNNRAICAALDALELPSGAEAIPDSLRRCYGSLVSAGRIGAEEMELLEAWLVDITSLSPTADGRSEQALVPNGPH